MRCVFAWVVFVCLAIPLLSACEGTAMSGKMLIPQNESWPHETEEEKAKGQNGKEEEKEAVLSGCADFAHVEPSRAPQYLAVHWLGWQNAYEYRHVSIKEVLDTVGMRGNENRRLAVSSTLSYFDGSAEEMRNRIRDMTKQAEENDVPIVIHLDGANQWRETGLWNWFDPEHKDRMGNSTFHPANMDNVERFDWGTDETTAVKIGWRDWGRQLRVEPAPNLASSAFREANAERLREILPVVADWYNGLAPDKKYLLGGVVLGQETSPYWGAFYYENGNDYLNRSPGEDPLGGPINTRPLGYAAAQTLAAQGVDIQTEGPISHTTIGTIINDYFEFLIGVTQEFIEPNKIITHALVASYHPYEAGISKVGGVMPGWTITNPNDQVKIDERVDNPYGGIPWAAAEFPNEVPVTAAALEALFAFGDCRQVNIKHWERIVANNDVDAIRTLLNQNPGPPRNVSNSQLSAGQKLSAGQQLFSPNGQNVLRMQDDGNLVLAQLPQGTPLWSSSTDGNPGAYALMQCDGEFSIISADGKTTLWATGTKGSGAVRARLQNDGNLALKTNAYQSVWTSWSELNIGMTLTPGPSEVWDWQNFDSRKLVAGTVLVSPNGEKFARMQADGGFALVTKPYFIGTWAIHWAPAGAYAKMEADGNLTVFSAEGRVYWQSGTEGSGAVKAVLQNNGHLVLKTKDNQPVWTSE